MAGDRGRLRLNRALRATRSAGPIVGFVVLFAIGPAAVLFVQGVASVGGWPGVEGVLSDPVNVRAVGNSIEQGAASALAAVAVGGPAGVLLGRYRPTGHGPLFALLLIPFLLPSLVVVQGVEALVGPSGSLAQLWPFLGTFGRGVPGIVLVNLVFNAPVVALLTATGVQTASAGLEDAASVLGAGPIRRFRDVWGPPALLGAAAGALLTFVFSALAFAAPLLVCGPRCSTLEVRVYALGQVLVDPSGAAVLALFMVGLLALPTVAYFVLWSRLRHSAAASTGRPRRIPWRSWTAWPAVAVTAVYVVLVALVLSSVIAQSLLPSSPRAGWGSAWSALGSPHVAAVLHLPVAAAVGNTLLFAFAATALALLLAIAGARAVAGRPRPGVGVSFLLFLPLLISPVVLAFSLATVWRPLLGGESTVWLLIVLSQTTLALPFALQSLATALRRGSPPRSEAAQTLGASPLGAYLDIDLPGARRGLVTAALFALAIALGEFTATYFLATPAFTTLPVALYHLLGARLTAPANALAALLVVVTGGAFAAISVGGERIEL